MKILITGGAGFIGSALIRYLINSTSNSVVNIDKLTYAGNLTTLTDVSRSARYIFEQVDICNKMEMQRAFSEHRPDAIMHLAAESHVDRSISKADEFIRTNIVGTYVLLEAARAYWQGLTEDKKCLFRFHHISTDEVYGDLNATDPAFTELNPYAPSSPYSASKASSDHLVRAWHRTYGLPILITNCSNNYGPYQFPEKLIPLMINNALSGKPLPIYGDGLQVRDWLYVDDHVKALDLVLRQGQVGHTYNIGGHNEKTNLEVVTAICDLLDAIAPLKTERNKSYKELITYVTDRPGHDKRYAINANKIQQELGFRPEETFMSGLTKTVQWYYDHFVHANRNNLLNLQEHFA